ncbi:ligand-binding sensor domain-containing protein [Chondrinema litorale]|uniref:ligand-binding sensor domain-containing protein n=1 Tax=Chondrinema litorale TaxID=2994555 RepID=UPI00254342E3|nr:two-component regulator propeller domain-containing protein [Chondrinema litorale]UZR98291.1 regulator [Chondrinema litorale]
MKGFFGLLILTLSFSACEKKTSHLTSHSPVDYKDSYYSDTSFIQEYHEGFLISTQNPDANNVRAIQPDKQGNIWIASKDGIYKKNADSNNWSLIITGKNQGPAYDVAIDKTENIWMATWNGVYSFQKNKLEKIKGTNTPKPPIAKIVTSEEGIYAMGPFGIWLYQNSKWEEKNYKTAKTIRAAISDGEEGLWIGTDVGLYHCNDAKTILYQKNEDLISAYVKGIDFSKTGDLWVGGLGGVSIRNQSTKIGEKRPKDGITHSEVNVVKTAPDGKIWVGTNYGITRFTPGDTAYSVRHSKRWLMDNEVRDITFDEVGNAWIATANGVSNIKRMEMTLADKAHYFYNQLIERHVREPWIIGRFKLTTAGDTSTMVPDDDDNDGEFTSNYLAMESFRYAVTQDPQAKERAKKAFDFLQYLREVTDANGFFARTIIPVSWEQSHDMNRTYTEHELAEELIKNPRHKPVETRWHVSEDGAWKWKGDTSSDEICGHFFGYYCYYNLVANNTEKQRIAEHVSKITDHLLENGFNLVDVDGTHTKWGVWSPKLLNDDPDWAQERDLNSLEILSFLKFAYHITKNETYQEAYLHLINDEGYLENAKNLYTKNPAWETYFDIYLALYLYPSLIKYEENPELQATYRAHLEQWYKKYSKTNSPLLNFTYNYLTGSNDGLKNSIFFLKDAPLDLVDWEIDNGSREDLQIVRKPILEDIQVNQLRPPSEYRTMRWDRNPYHAVGGIATQEREPVYWLLPYWMGRYLDLIK